MTLNALMAVVWVAMAVFMMFAGETWQVWAAIGFSTTYIVANTIIFAIRESRE